MKSKQKSFAALVAAHKLMAHPEQFQSNALKAAQGSPTGGIHAALMIVNTNLNLINFIK
ncbi:MULTISPECIES: hypothetical protein [Acinetobacter]|uniref:Uncharacterized protein n=1 Tax=Acinetobacter corruptisaponis TaxID=3045147 RepID=A0ABY8S8W9_9GAMM|nr:hypothetical protein [Acinetobacter sp. KCTC 92772]WHP06144.1 hypothetical protein QLH32_01300 [Acinetobacter sp. KCTC 92772]